MEIYKHENNIKDRILGGKTTASLSMPISISEETDYKLNTLINSLENIQSSEIDNKLGIALAKLSENTHPDLMYGEAILVSTIMNENDDVFLPEDTWAARNTPINTPFNEDHEESDIIGHIFACKVVDQDGKEIPDNIYENKNNLIIPDYFDIAVSFVVYKDIFPRIAKEISKGKKFVSMECKFNKFDYALVGNDGITKIVARNDNTSFLTKHLRIYGGAGKFKDYKLGRVLKDFRFSGMGNVDKPGNPSSKYTKIDNIKTVSNLESFNIREDIVIHVTKGKIMKTLKIETLDQANTVIAELNEQIAGLETAKSTEEIDGLKSQIQSLTTEKTDLTDKLTVANSKLDVVQQNLAKESDKIAEVNKTLDIAKAELKVKADELDIINTKTKSEQRFNELKELGFELVADKREGISRMTDDAYAQLVDFTKAMASKGTSTSDPEEVAKAEKASKDALDKAEADNKQKIEETKGDEGKTEAEKVQKTAAKLIEAIRSTKSKNNDKPKSKK